MGHGYAFIYTSQGYNIYLDLDALPWKESKAWWFNPRNGTSTLIKEIPINGIHSFDPPGDPGGDNDWILVIDDVGKNYIEPGKDIKIHK